MKISIIIPTYNNLKYLNFLLSSIKENSNYDHEIILHINDGSDGSLDYAKKLNIKYSHSNENIGLCSSVNTAAKLSTTNYILYCHDDMFFCKNWDLFLETEVNKYDDKLFYLTGTNVSVNNGLINLDCGNVPENFDMVKFDEFCINDLSQDLQGSHWAPHLVHKELWNRIGGFSEEFNPGDASDPDFCMKLWNCNVRVFKSISKYKVYHFNSITTRKSNIKLNNGTKQFLLKYGFNPRFFRKYYLKGNNLSPYVDKLKEPRISIFMLFDLIINKIKYFYYKILS